MGHDPRLLSADLERQSCAVALVMELMEHCGYAQMTLTEEAQVGLATLLSDTNNLLKAAVKEIPPRTPNNEAV